ncbi:MAG: hypothetical protein IKC01_09435 [Clostridia bacterium]|nr:hypothetical protein [Clostridia bacterium]
MEKNFSMRSQIKACGGVPALYINGKPYAAAAYMTYLENFNKYNDFANAGYKLFSVPVLFSSRWISITDGLTPFKKGIFDEKGSPDFSLFDEAVEKILDACPDAYIIPRVNLSMPLWWELENPDELNKKNGLPCRESFYSQKWRNDAVQLLRDFIQYSSTCRFAPHIAGYQIAGGNTEEWFHFDMNGGYGECAKESFREFLEEYHPEIEYRGLPDITLLDKKTDYFNDEYLTYYTEFANFRVAEAISIFAQAIKEETNNNVVVGTFYGYTLEVTNPLQGTHALNYILNDKNIDFICSPNSYIGVRSSDMDWTEMYPADSVRLHGKMCFQECDVRTHLTLPLSDKSPSTDPHRLLSAPIWQPKETKLQAMNEIRKSFARQLIKGNALWWFDMWGGWYADDDIMKEMAVYKNIYEQSLTYSDRGSKAEVAVFVDESAYKYLADCSRRCIFHTQRNELGIMGTPYDIYDANDFKSVYKNYKAVILLEAAKTECMKNAHKLCKADNIPCITTSEQKEKFTVNELREFCEKNGVHIFCETNDIIYVNENYLFIYAVDDGKKTLNLKKAKSVRELLGSDYFNKTSTFTLEMKKGESRLFALE